MIIYNLAFIIVLHNLFQLKADHAGSYRGLKCSLGVLYKLSRFYEISGRIETDREGIY